MISQKYPGYSMLKSLKILSTSYYQIIPTNKFAYIYPTKSLVMECARDLFRDLDITQFFLRPFQHYLTLFMAFTYHYTSQLAPFSYFKNNPSPLPINYVGILYCDKICFILNHKSVIFICQKNSPPSLISSNPSKHKKCCKI